MMEWVGCWVPAFVPLTSVGTYLDTTMYPETFTEDQDLNENLFLFAVGGVGTGNTYPELKYHIRDSVT